MKRRDLHKLVKEAVAEVKQEELQQEGKFGKFLSGVALLAALVAGNSKMNDQIYDQSPKLKVLVQKLEKAKADGNEELVDKIKILVKNQHHELLEDLAENIFDIIFHNRLSKKAKIKIEKLDIMKNSESVGVEFLKNKI